MSGGRWVDVRDEPGGMRRPAWLSPGLLVVVAFLLLIIVIFIGVIISRSGGEEVLDDITISRLRGDPSRYDGATVELSGMVERRYTIPLLDQYGLYEFTDGTGSIFVLSDKGVPPEDEQVRLTAVFNGATQLDDQIRNIVEDQFGSAAGFIVDQVLPGLPLNVLFLTHQSYATPANAVTPPESRLEISIQAAATRQGHLSPTRKVNSARVVAFDRIAMQLTRVTQPVSMKP